MCYRAPLAPGVFAEQKSLGGEGLGVRGNRRGIATKLSVALKAPHPCPLPKSLSAPLRSLGEREKGS